MWSPERLTRRAAVLGAMALAGCGFAPVYGPEGSALALRGKVEVTAPATADGYALRDRLEERLGRPSAAIYTLAMTLDVSRERVAVAEDSSITRYSLPGVANYTLLDANGAVLTTGQVDAFTSYSTTGTTVATRAAESDARARLAIILADLVVTRLLAEIG